MFICVTWIYVDLCECFTITDREAHVGAELEELLDLRALDLSPRAQGHERRPPLLGRLEVHAAHAQARPRWSEERRGSRGGLVRLYKRRVPL